MMICSLETGSGAYFQIYLDGELMVKGEDKDVITFTPEQCVVV